MKSNHNRRFVVLGGVGAIGRVVVRDLFESDPRNRILVADFNEATARLYARSFRSRRVRAAFADARKPAQLIGVLRGHSVVINCTQHDFNLPVMRAALKAKVHYVDLGGLFHWTRKQLKLHAHFQRAGLSAVLGMGCAPGITNLLARLAADRLDRVRSLRIRVGSREARPGTSLVFPYSAQTIVEELTLAPWVLRNGRLRKVPPRSGWERVRFPKPVGEVWTVLTRHSELATLPRAFRKRGLRWCDFKVSFDRGFVREVMRRLQRGWSPRQFAALPVPTRDTEDFEIARVIATGTRDGRSRAVTITVDCHARSRGDWNASAGDIDTGCPPSIVAQMIVTGQIAMRGVWSPEEAVPVRPFFSELRKRGLWITTGWQGRVELESGNSPL